MAYLDIVSDELFSAGLTANVESAIKEISNSSTDETAVILRDRYLGEAHKFISKHVDIALGVRAGGVETV